MKPSEIISVMIADDHNIIRHGLRQSLSQEKNIKVVAEADTGRKAIELADLHHPDIIIMDVSMPELNGVEATRKILKSYPDIKIIALSMHSEKQFVLSMIKAGVKGYLLKTNFFNELLTAIKAVVAGKVFLSPEITEHVVKSAISTSDENVITPLELLTDRERQVLQQIAEGKTNAYIAESLYISKKTVAAHRTNIMNKLKLDSIPALTKFAVKHGLTSLDI